MLSLIKMEKKYAKKNKTYAWIAVMFCLFFWVPILSIFFFLPAAIYCSIKQIRLVRRDAERYGGFVMSVICLIFSSISLLIGIIIFILSTLNKI